jgi:hypothetical protein
VAVTESVRGWSPVRATTVPSVRAAWLEGVAAALLVVVAVAFAQDPAPTPEPPTPTPVVTLTPVPIETPVTTVDPGSPPDFAEVTWR